MAEDKQHRALMEPIEREMRRKVDNSDEALVRRASDMARRMAANAGSWRLPTSVDVFYDDGPFRLLQGPGGAGDMSASEVCVRYFAIVTFEPDPKDVSRQIGRVTQKPADLDTKPNDPLVRWLIDETGAEPANTKTIYRRLHDARIACRNAGASAKEWRFSSTAYDEFLGSSQCRSVITHDRQRLLVMNLPVTLEYDAGEDVVAYDQSSDGFKEVKKAPSTVCIAAIGKRGRWEYFDA